MKCTHCGAEIAPDEKFCGECGHPRPQVPEVVRVPLTEKVEKTGKGAVQTAGKPKIPGGNIFKRYSKVLVRVGILAAVSLLLWFLGDRFIWGKAGAVSLSLDPSSDDSSPNLVQEHFYAGELAFSQQDFETAAAEYSLAIDLEPEYAPAFAARGSTYFHLGDFDRALADLNTAIGLDPGLAQAYCDRGGLYCVQGDLDSAMADLDQAIALDADLAAAYINRGAVHFSRDEFYLAATDFTEAIILDPQNGLAYHNRAATYIALGEWDLAQQDLAKAEELGYSETGSP